MTWDEKTKSSKTYKLQSNHSCNKIKAEVHQDSEKLSVKLLVNKMIPVFKKEAKKINFNYSHFFVEFKNVLLGQYKTAWKQVIHEHFLEPTGLEMAPAKHITQARQTFVVPWSFSSSRLFMRQSHETGSTIYIMPGGNYNIQKKIKMSPIDHLHQ
jgi:hypothetical protein